MFGIIGGFNNFSISFVCSNVSKNVRLVHITGLFFTGPFHADSQQFALFKVGVRKADTADLSLGGI